MYSSCTVVAFAHWNFIVFKLKKNNRYTCMLQISPLEETTIFTVIYFDFFLDVNTRKNFACIHFGVRVDSCT